MSDETDHSRERLRAFFEALEQEDIDDRGPPLSEANERRLLKVGRLYEKHVLRGEGSHD